MQQQDRPEELNLQAIKDRLIERLRPSGWAAKLKSFIYSGNFDSIIQRLWDTREEGKRFTPPLRDMFRAFEECPVDNLKVVILGQDPYPQLGVCDGIAFSCSHTGIMQPSLKYVLEAVNRTVYPGEDYDYDVDLKRWANQGVLLINSALSCEIGKPGTHYDIWQEFITYVIDLLSLSQSGLTWIFMGKKVQEFSELVNERAHYVLHTSHPAAASYAKAPMWDCKDVFNKCNEFIRKANGEHYTIKW